MDNLNLAKRDRDLIWHPFTQMQTAPEAIPIVRGEMSHLFTADGQKLFDGISSWWVNLHGHNHPHIAARIAEQAKSLDHVLFAGFTHQPAIELAERLLPLLPGEMARIFYSDNGSTAVETALKMALQFFFNRDEKTPRKKILCFNGSYHGDTFGAMAAAGKNRYNRPFWSHFFEVESIDPPVKGKEEFSIRQLEAILAGGEQKIAAFIFEPLLLGAGGMISYPLTGLKKLVNRCKQAGILTIADEVMTGFGRTGSLFAATGLKPDIICLAKGITGGFLPLAATACTREIYNAFLSDNPSKTLLHGHSYTANPICCAAANASLDLLLKSDSARARITAAQQVFVEKWRGNKLLKRCERVGTILILEYLKPAPKTAFFVERGVVLRPMQNVLYLMPPYCATADELAHVHKTIEETLV